MAMRLTKAEFAEEFGVDSKDVLMRNPTSARISYEWGNMEVSVASGEEYCIASIQLDKHKKFCLTLDMVEKLVLTLDETLKK